MYIFFTVDVTSVLDLLHVVVGDAADVSEAKSCTATHCNNPRTEVTSMNNHW
jgi:hypothetical protein